MKRPVQLLLLLSLCTALSSCFAFQARFQKEVAAAGGKHDKPTGPWHGRWKSAHNGHEGPLWCIVTETPDKPGFYDFRYRAGWGFLQFGNYVHTVKTAKTPAGALVVRGKMELPDLVGVHSLDGTVSNTEFNATYKSEKGDHGTMALRRPAAPPKKPAADPAAARLPAPKKQAAPAPAPAPPKSKAPAKPKTSSQIRNSRPGGIRIGSRAKSRGVPAR